jgi:raffinose/stachyose/melibiose transport system permease protein
MTTIRMSTRRVGRSQPRKWPIVLGFLLPALALYAVFVLLPVGAAMWYSAYNWNGLEPLSEFIGLDNFVKAFQDPIFRGALYHNMIILGLSLAVQLPFALFLAVLLDQNLKGRALMRMLFFAPYVLSEVVTAVVWRQIFRVNGALDTVVSSVVGHEFQGLWLANRSIVLYSLFFVISWKYFGFHMMLMLAGLQQIPNELQEAAAIDGASWGQTFRHVTLPLLTPAIRVSVFLSMIGSIQLFDVVWVLTQGGPAGASHTMATYMYNRGFEYHRFGYASAVSVVVFLLSLLVALAYQRWALSRDVEGSLTAMGA